MHNGTGPFADTGCLSVLGVLRPTRGSVWEKKEATTRPGTRHLLHRLRRLVVRVQFRLCRHTPPFPSASERKRRGGAVTHAELKIFRALHVNFGGVKKELEVADVGFATVDVK
jgi:hypothetical protein